MPPFLIYLQQFYLQIQISMTDISRAQKLLTNMRDSPSTEVRRGAFNTLFSKISCKLISLDEICALHPESAATMLYWIQDFYPQVPESTLQSALSVLLEMCRHESTRRRMRQSSTPAQFLAELRDWAHENSKKKQLSMIEECLEHLVDCSEQQAVVPLQVKNSSARVKTSTVKKQTESNSNYFSSSQQQEPQVQIIEKPDESKQEFIYLPYVKLLEVDEKMLFDAQIQLRFGNNQTTLQVLRDVIPGILRNFPVEVLRQKYELVQELIAIAQSHQKEDNAVYYACRCLGKVVRRIRRRLVADERWSSTQGDAEVFKGDPRESIRCSYPSLEPGEVARAEGQKTLKSIVVSVGVGMLEQSERFLGMKVRVLKEIKELLAEVRGRCEVEDVCVRLGKAIGQFLDRQECSVSVQKYAPLFLLGGDLLNLVESECDELKGICHYLSQAQFSYMLSREQSQQLLNKISLFDQNVLVHTGRVDSILAAVNLLWSQNHLLDTSELICLSHQELDHAIRVQRELLLSIPVADNLRFLKHYVQTYLYSLDASNDLRDCQDNLIQILYNPCRNSKLILYQTILQYMNDHGQLKKSKANRRSEEWKMNELVEQMLLNKKVLFHLYQGSLGDDELYRVMMEILMIFIKRNNLEFQLLYTSLLSRTSSQQSSIFIQLLCNSDASINDLYHCMNLFSRNEELRKQAYRHLLQWKSYQPFIQQPHLRIDPLDEFMNSDKTKFNYHDQLDEQISLIHVAKHSTATVESISNLETLVIDESEWHLKSAALQQLTEMYVVYLSNTKDFCKTLGVKLNQIASYWQSISDHMTSYLFKLPYKNCVATAFFNFIAHLFDFIALTNPSYTQELLDAVVYFLVAVDVTRQLKYSTLRLLYVLVFTYALQPQDYPQIQPLHSEYFTFWDNKIINRKPISYVETWSLYYPLSQNVQWYITQYVQHLRCGLSYDEYQKQYYTIKNRSVQESLDEFISYKVVGINCRWDDMKHQIQQLVHNSQFIGSSQMYLLNLVKEVVDNNDDLWNEFSQQISLLVNEQPQNVELVSLQLQIAYLIRKWRSEQQVPIVDVQNEKQLLYLVKLCLKQVIKPNQRIMNYMGKNVLQQSHHLNFTNSYYLKKYLIILIKNEIDPFYFLDDPLDRQVLFSQVLHLVSSHLSHVRLLALTLLHSVLGSLNQEQKKRVSELLQEMLLLPSEAQVVYSMAATVYQAYPNPPLPKLITMLHATLKSSSQANPFYLGAQVSLLCEWVDSEHRVETLQAIYSSGLDSLVCSLLRTKPLSINHSYLIAHCSSLVLALMRQSLSASLSLLQSNNLIELVARQLHKLSKHCHCEQAPIQCSSILQLACVYHRDYVCVQLRKQKHNPLKSLLRLLQCDVVKEKMPLGKTVQLVLSTGYDCDDCDAGELVLTLNALDRSDLDLVATMSSLVGVSPAAKQNFIRCESTYLNEMNKELDVLLLDTNKKPLNQSLSQSFGAAGDRKLLVYANLLANMHGVQDKPFMAGLVQVLSKLLQVSLRYPTLIDCFKKIVINHCSNASSAFIAKMTESKQNLILDMIKHSKSESVLECLGVVGQHNDLRLVMYRTKVFQDLNENLNQMWQNTRKWNAANKYAVAISKFFSALSFYKDAQTKILNNSATMELFISLIIEEGLQQELCQNLLLTMVNCALNSKNKMFYMGNQRFQPLIMSIICEEQNDLHVRVLGCQLIINLLYKSTQSISQFNMEEVIEELTYQMKDSQRQIERCSNENVLIQEKERQETKIKYLQQFQNQLNQILRILKIDW